MVHENEIVMLALGVGVYAFAMVCRGQLQRIMHWRTLFLAYQLLLAAWILTVLEGFWWGTVCNVLEHGCLAAGMVTLAGWCFRVTRGREGAQIDAHPGA
jgi:O-antigen/teichoic acid export membrane protein